MNRLAVPGPLHKMNGDITNAFPWFHVIVSFISHSGANGCTHALRTVRVR
jgi:hypothetical protein